MAQQQDIKLLPHMERSLVYKVINGERNYQESLNNSWCNNGFSSIAEEILLAEEYLTRAKHSYCTKYGDKDAGLSELRSVAAILVRCFEHHGVPERDVSTNTN